MVDYSVNVKTDCGSEIYLTATLYADSVYTNKERVIEYHRNLLILSAL